MKKWYAVQRYFGDSEWGTGSYDYDEAVAMLKGFIDGGDDPAEMMIAVIEEPEDGEEGEPMCVEEIHAEEII